MGSKSFAALIAASLSVVLGASSAWAAPVYTPFLSIDVNGNNGPTDTAQGFSAFNVSSPTGTSVSQTINGYGVTLSIAAQATGASFLTRDRGTQGSATDSSGTLYEDFLGVARDSGHGLGYSYLTIQVSGLTANANYEFTGFSDDPNSAGDANNRGVFTATDPATTFNGGYSPGAYTGSTPPSGTPTPGFAAPSTEYANSATLDAAANSSGVLTIYEYADTDSYSGQTATILNGFQVGLVASPSTPEPASLGLIGLAGAALLRRRRNA